MCQVTSNEQEYQELSELCERCGEITDSNPCASCLDGEREHQEYHYEPGYALLIDTSMELPW